MVSLAAKWLREQGETEEGDHDGGGGGAADEEVDVMGGVASLLTRNRKRTWAQVGVYDYCSSFLVFLYAAATMA